jgi:hypothetical protein
MNRMYQSSGNPTSGSSTLHHKGDEHLSFPKRRSGECITGK